MEKATLFKRVALRFARAFIGGFLAGVIVMLEQQPAVIDLTSLAQPLFFAGIVGGLLAVDKLFRG